MVQLTTGVLIFLVNLVFRVCIEMLLRVDLLMTLAGSRPRCSRTELRSVLRKVMSGTFVGWAMILKRS